MSVKLLDRPIYLKALPFSNLISPFDFLLFLYFSTTCAELLNVSFLIFKIKLNFLIGLGALLIVLFSKRSFISLKYLTSFLLLFLSVTLSSLSALNPIASAGFWGFFLFTYIVYFVVPMSLFRYFYSTAMKVYFQSFVLLGFFSLSQVFFSFLGIDLPFITQRIGFLARGQAWAYEPSFFALYMTPFIAYKNVLYFLKKEGTGLKIFLYNIMFLSTTSTGCFFTYLWMTILLAIHLKRCFPEMWKGFLLKVSVGFASMFSLFFLCFPTGFKMLFKFFIGGFFVHSSFWCRWNSLVQCWGIFMENPIFGVGLGNIPYYIMKNEFSSDIDLLVNANELFPPMNVTTEIFASLGLFGVFAFCYLFFLIYSDFCAAFRLKTVSDEERAKLLAFAVSLIVTAFTYQFSQSMMRSYIWLHIAVSLSYVGNLLRVHRKGSIPKQPEQSVFSYVGLGASFGSSLPPCTKCNVARLQTSKSAQPPC